MVEAHGKSHKYKSNPEGVQHKIYSKLSLLKAISAINCRNHRIFKFVSFPLQPHPETSMHCFLLRHAILVVAEQVLL